MLAIPCNTAHYFYDRLNQTIPVPILNMVEETVRTAKQRCDKVGILATSGTIETRTYQRQCEAQGLACEVPCPADQQKIMDIIYKDIKQGKPADMQAFCEVSDHLRSAGCGRIILGCTELSLIKRDEHLDSFYIDSMEVLAKHAILAFGKTPIGFEED